MKNGRRREALPLKFYALYARSVREACGFPGSFSKFDEAAIIGDQAAADNVPFAALTLQVNVHGALGARSLQIYPEACPSLLAVVMDVADPIQPRMLDAAHCILHNRVVLRELKRERRRRAAAQVKLAEHDHHYENDAPALERLARIG